MAGQFLGLLALFGREIVMENHEFYAVEGADGQICTDLSDGIIDVTGDMNEEIGNTHLTLSTTLILGFALSSILVALSLTNLDAAFRNILLIAESYEWRTGSRKWRSTVTALAVLFLMAIIFFLFLVCVNGLSMSMSACEPTMEDPPYEADSEEGKKIDALYTGVLRQKWSLRVACIVFPVSWIMILVTFFCLLGCYKGPLAGDEVGEEDDGSEAAEERQYRGLDTEELQVFSQKSKKVENGRITTEDECAICCATLKDTDVLTVPAACQHRYHEACL